jgi:type VI protein secretion system component Hcp
MHVENNVTFLELDEALRSMDLVSRQNGEMDVWMQLNTKRSGDVTGESVRSFSDGKPRVEVLGYYMSVGTSSDAGSDRSSGRRRYSAVRVIRNCDAATSTLLSGLKGDDDLTVKLESYRAGGDTSQKMLPKFSILLENARLRTYTVLNGGAMPNSGAVEILEFSFRNIMVDSSPQTATGQRGAMRTFTDIVQ